MSVSPEEYVGWLDSGHTLMRQSMEFGLDFHIFTWKWSRVLSSILFFGVFAWIVQEYRHG